MIERNEGDVREPVGPPELSDIIISLRDEEWKRPWISAKIIGQLLEKEGKFIMQELGRAPLPTEKGDWTYFVFGDLTRGVQHQMLAFGNFLDGNDFSSKRNILVRIHSSCHTNEVFGAVNCECRAQLHQAMSLIQSEGEGIILYLDQEGRGNGIVAKLAQLNGMFGWKEGRIEQKLDAKTGKKIDTYRAYKEAGYPSESRDFTVAGEMLKKVGVKSVRLLTNNPKKITGIEKLGIKVTPVEIHITPGNEIIAVDLQSKAENLGHNIRKEHWQIKKNR